MTLLRLALCVFAVLLAVPAIAPAQNLPVQDGGGGLNPQPQLPGGDGGQDGSSSGDGGQDGSSPGGGAGGGDGAGGSGPSSGGDPGSDRGAASPGSDRGAASPDTGSSTARELPRTGAEPLWLAWCGLLLLLGGVGLRLRTIDRDAF